MSNHTTQKTARLALEDGAVFHGIAFGAITDANGKPTTAVGEVIFNTAMTGYQEALTDASYAGQILTMTAPLVGNYGVNRDDMESARIQVRGFIIRELSRVRSNYRSNTDLSDWLRESGVLGIQGIDTRALTRRIRTAGAMRGVITCDDSMSDDGLVRMANESPSMSGANFVDDVAATESCGWNEDLGDWGERQIRLPAEAVPDGERKLRVIALDCGAKRNILRHLTSRGCDVIVLPPTASVGEIRSHDPDGLFVSNGPGDPAAVTTAIETLREAAGTVPTFGICLGHQLLCLALGGKTFKLKFGHRGANQPVKNLMTGRVEITSQNHGFAVDPESLSNPDDDNRCEPTHVHLNDGTLAGFRHLTKPIFAVQYHPEASPGPHDSGYLFDLFVRMMRSGRPISTEDVEAVQAFVNPEAASTA